MRIVAVSESCSFKHGIASAPERVFFICTFLKTTAHDSGVAAFAKNAGCSPPHSWRMLLRSREWQTHLKFCAFSRLG